MEFRNFGFLIDQSYGPKVFQLLDMGVETQNSSSYHYDNLKRAHYEGYIFQYTLKGSGVYTYNGTSYNMEPGMAFFTKVPDESAYFYNGHGATAWEFFYIHIDGIGVDDFYRQYHFHSEPVCHIKEDSPLIRRYVSIHQQLCHGHEMAKYEGSHFVSDFLHDLLAAIDRQKEATSDYVTKSIDLMEALYFEQRGLATIVETLGISHSHFTRLFKEEMGITPIAYMTNIRMKKAVDLLLNSHDSIEHIAQSCGYACGNYFSKAFKEAIGMSPSAYRKSH